MDVISGLATAEVVVIRWPAESDRRDECHALGLPRLLVVEGQTRAPICTDVLEDWVRPPMTSEDFSIRAQTLHIRARSGAVPRVDPSDVLAFGGQSLPLSPAEARIMRPLSASFRQVVARDVLAVHCWPDEAAARRNALDLHILRLRRRIRPLGLCIATVWSRGYVLENCEEGRIVRRRGTAP